MNVNDVDQCYEAYRKYRNDLKREVLNTHPKLQETEFDSTWLSELTAAQFGFFWARLQQNRRVWNRWVRRLTSGYPAYDAELRGKSNSRAHDHRAA